MVTKPRKKNQAMAHMPVTAASRMWQRMKRPNMPKAGMQKAQIFLELFSLAPTMATVYGAMKMLAANSNTHVGSAASSEALQEF